jgi:hypothetical protein
MKSGANQKTLTSFEAPDNKNQAADPSGSRENSRNMEVSPCSVLLLGRFERNAVIERFERLEPAAVLDSD